MNVLVIEDDERIAHVIQQGLTEDGHRVHTACDGVEGLSLINSEHFDAAVLDVMLPGMDGFYRTEARARRRIGASHPYTHRQRLYAGHRSGA